MAPPDGPGASPAATGARERRADLARALRTALHVGLAALLAVGATAVAMLAVRQRAEGWVVHTREVLRTAREAFTLASDRLSGARGYLLTGDERSLVHARAAAGLPAKLDSLVARTADNPVQHARALALRAALLAFERDFAMPVVSATLSPAERAEAVRAARAGQPLFDAARVPYAAFIAEEDRLFRARVGRLRAVEAGALALVLAELTVAAAVLVRFHQRVRRQAGDLLEQQSMLEEQAVELEMSAESLAERARELEETNRRLADANREIAGFSYTVAHDLRAPLRSIDGYTHVLLHEHGDALDAEARGYLGRVRVNAQRMSEMIDGLLTLARIRRGDVREDAVDLSAMAREILEELQRLEPSRAVDARVADGLAVRGDRRLLRVALQNLLGNAWKFTRERARATIEVGRVDRAREDGGPVYFVRDDGAGFDMAYAAQLFGTFQRLHDGRRFEGTGIGLATVRRVVERHGGRVWAEGVPEGGATFYFTVGRATPAETDAPPEVAAYGATPAA